MAHVPGGETEHLFETWLVFTLSFISSVLNIIFPLILWREKVFTRVGDPLLGLIKQLTCG
jgi:hypothetical protein